MIDPSRLAVFYAASLALAVVPGPAVAFLPQFVDPARGSEAGQIAVLGAIFVVLGLMSDSTHAVVAGPAADRLRRKRRFAKMQRYVAGAVFVGLGVTAALTGSARRG